MLPISRLKFHEVYIGLKVCDHPNFDIVEFWVHLVCTKGGQKVTSCGNTVTIAKYGILTCIRIIDPCMLYTSFNQLQISNKTESP